jgi:hypothetical protein
MSDKGSRRPRAPRPLQQVLYRVTTSFALKAGWSEATELKEVCDKGSRRPRAPRPLQQVR